MYTHVILVHKDVDLVRNTSSKFYFFLVLFKFDSDLKHICLAELYLGMF